MVSFKIDREAGLLILSYPEYSGMQNEVLKLTSNRDALGVWRLRVRSYVMNTMMKYYKNRQLGLSPKMTADREQALKKIRKVLLENYEGKLLENFLWKVMLLAEEVILIAPHPKSKHYNYYHTVVYPMYQWIEKYIRWALRASN